MREVSQGGYARHGRANARGKAGKKSEARHDRKARQDRADARGNTGQIREARQGIQTRQGRADSRGKFTAGALGKAGLMRDART
jgi:hypothetical protein